MKSVVVRDFKLSDIGNTIELRQEDQEPAQVLVEVVSQGDLLGCWILSK